MVAGAYRCPVCGIDFPTGTPGTPHASGSAAEVERGRSREGGAAVPPEDLAARLRGALDEELAIGEEAGTLGPAVSAPGERAGEADDREPGREVVVEAPETVEATPAEPVVPGRPRRREGRGGGSADLTLAPARERPGPPARAERRRDKAVATRTRGRRRSKSGSLALTLVMALLLLGGAGAGALWLDLSGRLDLGIVGDRIPAALRPLPRDITVTAGEGWVDVPAGEGTVSVTADGPFRVRLDGLVYSLEGGRTLAIPMDGGRRVEVRAVGEETVATVSRVE